MKKLTWLFASIFSFTSIVGLAQPPQQMPVEDRVKRTIERLKPELSLTDKQITEMTPVYTEFYTEIDKLRAAGTPPSPEDRQKLTATRDEKLKKILDEGQMKKLKELEEQMRQQRRQGGPPQLKN